MLARSKSDRFPAVDEVDAWKQVRSWWMLGPKQVGHMMVSKEITPTAPRVVPPPPLTDSLKSRKQTA